MRRYVAKAFGTEQTGEDELHNPVCEPVELFSFEVRLGPWHEERSDEPGNALTTVTRTLFTRAPASRFEGVSSVSVRGHEYRVANVMRDGGRTAITVRGAKPWAFS